MSTAASGCELLAFVGAKLGRAAAERDGPPSFMCQSSSSPSSQPPFLQTKFDASLMLPVPM